MFQSSIITKKLKLLKRFQIQRMLKVAYTINMSFAAQKQYLTIDCKNAFQWVPRFE